MIGGVMHQGRVLRNVRFWTRGSCGCGTARKILRCGRRVKLGTCLACLRGIVIVEMHDGLAHPL